jgi:hypothetical protein
MSPNPVSLISPTRLKDPGSWGLARTQPTQLRSCILDVPCPMFTWGSKATLLVYIVPLTMYQYADMFLGKERQAASKNTWYLFPAPTFNRMPSPGGHGRSNLLQAPPSSPSPRHTQATGDKPFNYLKFLSPGSQRPQFPSPPCSHSPLTQRRTRPG